MVAALNGVHAHDWTRFLRDRLDGRTQNTNGIEASGWKLVYRDEPNALAKPSAGDAGNYTYSLGLALAKDGKSATCAGTARPSRRASVLA